MATTPTPHLLGLPAELRLQIYRGLLVQEGRWLVGKEEPLLTTTLSLVCKTTKSEAEPILWQKNSFHAYAEDADLTPAIEWLRRAGREKASMIKNFRIKYKTSDRAKRAISYRIREWEPGSCRIPGGHDKGEIHREYGDETWRHFRHFVPQFWQLVELGLPKSSIKYVNVELSSERLQRIRRTRVIMAGIHTAVNKKLEQLVRGTYLIDEEEIVVQMREWSVMVIFEREDIWGPIYQSCYLNRSKLMLERGTPSHSNGLGLTERSYFDYKHF